MLFANVTSMASDFFLVDEGSAMVKDSEFSNLHLHTADGGFAKSLLHIKTAIKEISLHRVMISSCSFHGSTTSMLLVESGGGVLIDFRSVLVSYCDFSAFASAVHSVNSNVEWNDATWDFTLITAVDPEKDWSLISLVGGAQGLNASFDSLTITNSASGKRSFFCENHKLYLQD